MAGTYQITQEGKGTLHPRAKIILDRPLEAEQVDLASDGLPLVPISIREIVLQTDMIGVPPASRPSSLRSELPETLVTYIVDSQGEEKYLGDGAHIINAPRTTRHDVDEVVLETSHDAVVVDVCRFLESKGYTRN